MPAFLDSIVAATRQRLSEVQRAADLRSLEAAAAQHHPRGFRAAIEQAGHNGIAVISELKKASPSKGLIRADFDPAALARDLERSGAAALSVLTDEPYFQGSLGNLREASGSTSLPCLRKDFIVDEFQIVEARANRADAILLIVAALQQRELGALAASARSHGLDVLCEAHDSGELQRGLDAGCSLIGVNSRNLRTFDVNLDTAFELIEKIPEDALAVAESGIQTGADLARLRAAGYDGFLIGESLMRERQPGEALARLIEDAKSAFVG